MGYFLYIHILYMDRVIFSRQSKWNYGIYYAQAIVIYTYNPNSKEQVLFEV